MIKSLKTTIALFLIPLVQAYIRYSPLTMGKIFFGKISVGERKLTQHVLFSVQE